MQNLPFFNNLCFKCPNYIVENLSCQAYNKNCVLVKDCDYYNKAQWPDEYVNPAYPLGPSDGENTKPVYYSATTQSEDNIKVSLEYENGIPVLYGVFTKDDLKLEWKV